MQELQAATPPSELAKTKTGLIFLGGGGGNVARMLITLLDPAEYPDFYILVANTDARQLRLHFPDTDEHVQKWKAKGALELLTMGENLTKGQGAGTNPEIGRSAANETQTLEAFNAFIRKCDNVFITAGLGGGTGT